jgi:hypothetical protein
MLYQDKYKARTLDFSGVCAFLCRPASQISTFAHFLISTLIIWASPALRAGRAIRYITFALRASVVPLLSLSLRGAKKIKKRRKKLEV